MGGGGEGEENGPHFEIKLAKLIIPVELTVINKLEIRIRGERISW